MPDKNISILDWDRTVRPNLESKIESPESKQTRYRELELDLRSAGNDRTITASLSSEEPYQRSFGFEILSHSKKAIDLGRAKDGLPLLHSHDHTKQIGIVENIRILGSRLVGTLRFGKSSLANEAWEDVKSGIQKNMSIGYQVLEIEETEESEYSRGNIPTFVVERWVPYEASLVSVPADPTVGVNRSHKAQEMKEFFVKKEVADGLRDYKRVFQYEPSSKVMELANNVSQKHELEELEKAINLELLERDSCSPKKMELPMVNTIEERQYSITNVLRAMSGERKIDIGFETECDQELQRQRNKSTNGFLIPLNARDITSAGDGANLIGTDHLSNNFIDVLRARSVIMRLGPTVLNNLVGNIDIPKKTTASTAVWADLDGTQDLTPSDPTFGKVSLTPKTVGALTTFSHNMLKQGSPDIENLVRQDLFGTISSEIDKQAIQGDGLLQKPTGILNVSGINADTYALGGNPSFADIVGLEGLVAASNADAPGMAYIASASMMSQLKSTDVGTDTGQFVWKPGQQPGEGRMNGYTSVYTNNIPDGTILFGNFRDLILGHWGVVEIDADPYGTNFAKGSVTVRAIMDLNLTVRHAESFAALTEATS